MSDGPHKPWVRMRALFGESVVPPESAAVIARALNLMVATRVIPPDARWVAVEFWAADWLAGYEAQKAALRIANDPDWEPPTETRRPPEDQARRR